MSKYLVYVDDEPVKVEEYREGLTELGYKLCFFKSAEEAWDWLESNHRNVACYVLDVMLPPEDMYDLSLTDNGQLTGLFLYRDIRGKLGETATPVFLLTNNADPAIRQAIIADSNVEVVLKDEVLFDDLAEIVRRTLETRKL